MINWTDLDKNKNNLSALSSSVAQILDEITKSNENITPEQLTKLLESIKLTIEKDNKSYDLLPLYMRIEKTPELDKIFRTFIKENSKIIHRCLAKKQLSDMPDNEAAATLILLATAESQLFKKPFKSVLPKLLEDRRKEKWDDNGTLVDFPIFKQGESYEQQHSERALFFRHYKYQDPKTSTIKAITDSLLGKEVDADLGLGLCSVVAQPKWKNNDDIKIINSFYSQPMMPIEEHYLFLKRVDKEEKLDEAPGLSNLNMHTFQALMLLNDSRGGADKLRNVKPLGHDYYKAAQAFEYAYNNLSFSNSRSNGGDCSKVFIPVGDASVLKFLNRLVDPKNDPDVNEAKQYIQSILEEYRLNFDNQCRLYMQYSNPQTLHQIPLDEVINSRIFSEKTPAFIREKVMLSRPLTTMYAYFNKKYIEQKGKNFTNPNNKQEETELKTFLMLLRDSPEKANENFEKLMTVMSNCSDEKMLNLAAQYKSGNIQAQDIKTDHAMLVNFVKDNDKNNPEPHQQQLKNDCRDAKDNKLDLTIKLKDIYDKMSSVFSLWNPSSGTAHTKTVTSASSSINSTESFKKQPLLIIS